MVFRKIKIYFFLLEDRGYRIKYLFSNVVIVKKGNFINFKIFHNFFLILRREGENLHTMSAIVADTNTSEATNTGPTLDSEAEHTKIANAISKAEVELHQLWDIVGLGDDDRGRILSEIYQNINGVITSVLEEEQELCEQYKTRIAEALRNASMNECHANDARHEDV